MLCRIDAKPTGIVSSVEFKLTLHILDRSDNFFIFENFGVLSELCRTDPKTPGIVSCDEFEVALNFLEQSDNFFIFENFGVLSELCRTDPKPTGICLERPNESIP
jgi:hypothetical protein